MTNLEKYQEAFVTALGVDLAELNEAYTYESRAEWDSVVHMLLIAELEEKFEIEMEMEDIIDLSSYEKGKEILAKYGVEL